MPAEFVIDLTFVPVISGFADEAPPADTDEEVAPALRESHTPPAAFDSRELGDTSRLERKGSEQ